MSLVLKHNGAEVDLAAARAELGSLVHSFLAPSTLTLRRSIAFDEPTDWQNEDSIELLRDDATVFQGRVRSSERVASAQGEQIVYTCVGPRDAADGVPFQRTMGGTPSARVVYNCPDEEVAEEAGYVALPGTTSTVGEIHADILDATAGPLAGIIGTGGRGSGYIAAELDALASVPGKVVLNGLSVDEAILALLRHAPDFGFFIDPQAHKARFIDFRTLTAKDVAGVGDRVLRHELDFSTAGCYSACTVQGAYELVDTLETLTPAWDPGLEPQWSPQKAAAEPDTYGLVWRLFAASEPAAVGGVILPERFAGEGDIVAVVTFHQTDQLMTCSAAARVVDDTKLLLNLYAREWDPEDRCYRPATVAARFTYRLGRISGRYPATGHAGTAYTRRGLARELFLIQEERCKKTLKGTIAKTFSGTHFIARYELALKDELVGMAIQFNDSGVSYVIADNDFAAIVLEEAPLPPIEEGDHFAIFAQDDTRKDFEGGTLSILEKYAKEALARVMDERFVGRAPLAGLDWSIALGQQINFTGTNDPEYASLGATLIAVEHDLAAETTILSLTGDRALGATLTWGELDRQRQRDHASDEHAIQIRRLWRRLRRRHAEQGSKGDPHVADSFGPYTGDGAWIEIDEKTIRHIGPSILHRTIGGPGQYIQWITLDLRGHVIDAAACPFS